jgi:uroporphyrinogen decarboxylase
MTSREIINSLVKDKICPERMGLFEHYWMDTQEEWEKQGLPKGINLDDYFNYDIRFVPGSWFDTYSFPNTRKIIEETEETIVYENGWGTRLREWKAKMGTPEHLGFDMIDRDIWNKKYRENLLSLDLNRFGNIEELKEKYRTLMATDKFVAYHNMFIFEIMRKSMGDVVMLESMYLDPDWIHDFCDVITNNMIMHLEYMFREIGVPDGMWLYEDMGYTQAPFISPKLYREMIYPYHKKMGDFIHSYNIPFIMHSCGKIESFVPDIAKAGIDCLQVLEAKAGQHVVKMAESVNNKMAFMGNLNIVAYETNNAQKIDDEIIPKMKAVKEKKIPYVFHSDHSIPKSVTLKTYEYVLELYKKYSSYQ